MGDDAALQAYWKAINDQAPDEPVNPKFPLPKYFAVVRQLQVQGDQYFALGEAETAYIYLKRFAKMGINVLPAHPDYGQERFAADKRWMKQEVSAALIVLASLKGKIIERYHIKVEEEAKAAAARAASAAAAAKMATATAPAATGAGGAAGALGTQSEDFSTSFANLRLDTSKAAAPSPAPAATVAYPTVSTPTPAAAAPWTQSGGSSQIDSVSETRLGLSRMLGTQQLRKLLIPDKLIATFTKMAAKNTKKKPRGIETCAILAGVMDNASTLRITTLVFPQQTAGPDNCAMTDDGENQLFTYCSGKKLLTLGWIHTHPDQGCFLSAIDVHTHCGFQTMMPEAIAIVVAPTDSKLPIGYFRLTHPHGLKLIQNCRLTGFHPHESRAAIYEQSGHVANSKTKLTIKDFR